MINNSQVTLTMTVIDNMSPAVKQVAEKTKKQMARIERVFKDAGDAVEQFRDVVNKVADSVEKASKTMSKSAKDVKKDWGDLYNSLGDSKLDRSLKRILKAFKKISKNKFAIVIASIKKIISLLKILAVAGAAALAGLTKVLADYDKRQAMLNSVLGSQQKLLELQGETFDKNNTLADQARAFAKSEGSYGVFSKEDIEKGIAMVSIYGMGLDKVKVLTQRLRGVALATGKSMGHALKAVTRAMYEGESELAEGIRLRLRDEAINKEAIKLYGKKMSALLEQQKINVRYNAIIEQTNKFQGIENALLEKTGGKLQALKARFQGVSETIAIEFEPAIISTLELLAGFVNRVEKEAKNGLFKGVVEQITDVTKKLKTMLDTFDTNTLTTSLSKLSQQLSELLTDMATHLGKTFGKAFVHGIYFSVETGIRTTIESLKRIIPYIKQQIDNLFMFLFVGIKHERDKILRKREPKPKEYFTLNLDKPNKKPVESKYIIRSRELKLKEYFTLNLDKPNKKPVESKYIKRNLKNNLSPPMSAKVPQSTRLIIPPEKIKASGEFKDLVALVNWQRGFLKKVKPLIRMSKQAKPPEFDTAYSRGFQELMGTKGFTNYIKNFNAILGKVIAKEKTLEERFTALTTELKTGIATIPNLRKGATPIKFTALTKAFASLIEYRDNIGIITKEDITKIDTQMSSLTATDPLKFLKDITKIDTQMSAVKATMEETFQTINTEIEKIPEENQEKYKKAFEVVQKSFNQFLDNTSNKIWTDALEEYKKNIEDLQDLLTEIDKDNRKDRQNRINEISDGINRIPTEVVREYFKPEGITPEVNRLAVQLHDLQNELSRVVYDTAIEEIREIEKEIGLFLAYSKKHLTEEDRTELMGLLETLKQKESQLKLSDIAEKLRVAEHNVPKKVEEVEADSKIEATKAFSNEVTSLWDQIASHSKVMRESVVNEFIHLVNDIISIIETARQVKETGSALMKLLGFGANLALTMSTGGAGAPLTLLPTMASVVGAAPPAPYYGNSSTTIELKVGGNELAKVMVDNAKLRAEP